MTFRYITDLQLQFLLDSCRKGVTSFQPSSLMVLGTVQKSGGHHRSKKKRRSLSSIMEIKTLSPSQISGPWMQDSAHFRDKHMRHVSGMCKDIIDLCRLDFDHFPEALSSWLGQQVTTMRRPSIDSEHYVKDVNSSQTLIIKKIPSCICV